MSPEIRTATRWYLWLWLSPLLTIPTETLGGVVLGSLLQSALNHSLAVLLTGLWHLVLLIPALGYRSQFVRWHGRQALLLAGLRTLVPLSAALIALVPGEGLRIFRAGGFSLPLALQIALWAGGTWWAQRQAARGDCALMRWTDHGAGLPLPTAPAKAMPSGPALDPERERLEAIVQFANDPARRREALAELQRRGWAEPL